ncbi:hypothetical protein BT69DRAFT_1381005 [Atractiella rhizophila]|nr:hypothetical protein BT69DRAFT_1381005 [Atractiella rhizophila]
MAAQSRSQPKKGEGQGQERRQQERSVDCLHLRNGRMIAKVGSVQPFENIWRKRNAGTGRRLIVRYSRPAPALNTESKRPKIARVINPLPSLQSVVSYSPGTFDTSTASIRKLHAAHFDRLRHSKTFIPQKSVTESDLLSNRFYCSYLIHDVKNLPTLSGKTLLSVDQSSFFDAEPGWDDDHVMACRVVPLLGRPLASIFPQDCLELDDVDREALRDITAIPLEELEFTLKSRTYRDNPFLDLFVALEAAIRNGPPAEYRGRRIFHILTAPVFDRRAKASSSANKLTFDYVPAPVEDSFPLGGERFSILRYDDVVFGPFPSDSKPETNENKIPVCNFYFQAHDPLNFRSPYSEAFRQWNGVRGSVRDKRKHPRRYEDRASPIPSRTPTPPPIPSQSQYIATQNIASAASYAAELRLMLAQITSNAKEYGMGDMSEEYDLATVEGRRGALIGVIALSKYLLSGKAKIGRLQKAFS